MGDDADGHELFAVVASVHHQRVGQALDDGTLCLSEALHGVAAGGVGDVDWLSDLDVVAVHIVSSACTLALPPLSHQFILLIAITSITRDKRT